MAWLVEVAGNRVHPGAGGFGPVTVASKLSLFKVTWACDKPIDKNRKAKMKVNIFCIKVVL
jgi:hypothetical protein